MDRKGFVFYSNWKKSLEGMPDDIRLEVYESVIDYAFTGNIRQLTPLAKVAFNFMKPGLDLDTEKYKSTVKRNSTNALSRKKAHSHPVALNKDKDKNKDKNKKESTNVDEKETCVSSFSCEYEKYLTWLSGNAPFCANRKNFAHQITEPEFDKLKQKYTGTQLAEVIMQLENRKDLRKRYTNLYRTVLNWAKRAYGD